MMEKTIRKILLFSGALLLAAYALPVVDSPVVLNPDGTPAGWLAQSLQPASADKAHDWVHWWDEAPIWLAAVFAAPLALVLLRRRVTSSTPATVLRLLTPVVGLALLALMVGLVSVADMDIFPFAYSELAVGAYTALAALGLFCLVALTEVGLARSGAAAASRP